jgi:hypothetical protein
MTAAALHFHYYYLLTAVTAALLLGALLSLIRIPITP